MQPQRCGFLTNNRLAHRLGRELGFATANAPRGTFRKAFLESPNGVEHHVSRARLLRPG